MLVDSYLDYRHTQRALREGPEAKPSIAVHISVIRVLRKIKLQTDLVPGVVISIVEAELHDADGPQLYAGPQEFAPQLAVTNHVPLLSLGIGSHDGRMVHDL